MEESLRADKRHSILELVRRFREHDSIKSAVEVRNRFVHLYRRDEPDWRWSMFVPAARISEWSTADEFAAKLRGLAESSHVDDYADAQADRLYETLREVQRFRDDLYGAVLSDLAMLVAGRDEETQMRFQWVHAFDDLWRELGGETDETEDKR